MKQELKVILLNQYVGAIAIGYLIGRGFEVFFAAFMPAINSVLRQFLSGTREVHDTTLHEYFLFKRHFDRILLSGCLPTRAVVIFQTARSYGNTTDR